MGVWPRLEIKTETNTWDSGPQINTRSSAIAERPRDASCRWAFCLVTQNQSLFRGLRSSPISQHSVWSEITSHNPLHWSVTSLSRCSYAHVDPSTTIMKQVSYTIVCRGIHSLHPCIPLQTMVSHWWLRSIESTPITVRRTHFVLVFHCNYLSIFYRFWDTQRRVMMKYGLGVIQGH